MEITKEAYSEVYAIINLMSYNLLNKIPENILKVIDDKRDKNMNIEIVDINQYLISDEANQLLAVLYKNYFATTEERNVIKAKEQIILKKEQEMIQETYNPDNLFKNKKDTQNIVEDTVKQEVALIEYKESLFKKIWNKILSIF